METIAILLILAGLGGVGYMAWRLLRRQRGEGDPAGHPSIVGRVLPTTLLAFFLGATLAPPDEATNEGERVAQERDGAGSAAQQGSEGDAREGEEAAQRERRAERRRRAGETGRVTRVIDGDTVEIAGVGRVRLIGVDTPERGDECYDEATGYLRGRVGGKTVRYRYQQERTDRYDRALLDLFRAGQLVNLDVAEAGWGEELTIQPNDRYAARIAEAEAEARAAGRGRWGGCVEEPEPAPGPERERAPAPSDDEDSGSSGGGGGAPSGTCSEVGITDFRVPPGDPRDRDGDGIACES